LLNWFAIIALVFALAYAFRRGDDCFVKKIRVYKKRTTKNTKEIFKLLSNTPFIAVVFFLVPGLILLLEKDWYTAAALTAGCSLSLGIAFIGKHLLGRDRPFGNTTYLGDIDSSFPSAHTAGAFSAALMLSTFWPALGGVFFVFAALIAFSRMFLELHFFSDVIGGILVAYLVTRLVIGTDFLVFFGF
jgi:undecaprenyl-diphosphatase